MRYLQNLKPQPMKYHPKNNLFPPRESTDLNPGGSQSKPPTKEQTWAGPKPLCTYVADVQPGLHASPPTTGAWAVPDSIACLWILFHKLGCLGWLQWESCNDLRCQGRLIPRGNHCLLRGEEKKGVGDGPHGWGLRGVELQSICKVNEYIN